MTSRARIEAALSHREPDRTPIFEYVLCSPLAQRLLDRPYAGDPDTWREIAREQGWYAAVRQRAVDRLELALLLGHDMMYVVPNPPLADAEEEDRESGAIPADNVEDPVERVRLRNERRALKPPPSDDIFLIYAYLREEMQESG